jgi:hypothetical protein
MNKNIIYLLLAFQIISCSEKKIQTTELTPIEKFSDFGFDHFLTSLSSLEFSNETFYITEYEFSRLILLKRDFSEKLLIDNSDREFGIVYPTYAHPIDGKIAVYNSGRQKIEFYNYEGQKYESPSITINTELLNFAHINGKLVFSIIPSDLNNPFVIYDLKLKSSERFGDLSDISYNQFQQIYNSLGYVFPFQKNFITIKPTTGEIISYNEELEPTFKTNILDDLNLSSVIEEINEFYKASTNSTIEIISDCKIHDDKLYLLIYNRKPEEKPNPREVIVFDIKKGGVLKLEKIYNLGDENSYYSKICLVSKDKLAAFEIQTSDIHIFDLK